MYLATGVVSGGIQGFLKARLSTLGEQGILRQGHINAASAVANISNTALSSASIAYSLKKISDNKALRTYYSAQYSNKYNIKNVGSKEYEDVIKRSKKSNGR